MRPETWLERYVEGARDEVWRELREVGSALQSTDDAEHAQLVCDEMARRARRNIELVIEVLSHAGYRFHTNDDEQKPVVPHIPPGPGANELAQWLAETVGPVPMTVSSWLRIVGDVWLVGTHPKWTDSASADPLVIELEGSRFPEDSMKDFYLGEVDAWRYGREDAADIETFVLPAAPDRLHKENTSGGAPYGFRLPDTSAEGIWVGATTVGFVNYLNATFRHGGFPWPTGSRREAQLKRELSADLLHL